MTKTRPLTDVIAGGLLGLAAGDALGATVEFLRPDQIQARYGVHRDIIGGGAFNWRPGQGTDDTDLAWAVTVAYLEGNYSLYAVAAELLDWYHTNPPDIGGTTRHALAQLAETSDPSTSGLTTDRSCGNGSLMRALPTGLIRRDAERRQREAAEISAITHAHPRCVDSCIAYTEIAAALVAGDSPAEAIARARTLDLDPVVRTALATPGSVPVTEMRTSGYVIDSLACAVWAIQQPTDFETTLVALVNRGDDADTTAAIAGGLLGISAGPDGIPARWRTQLEYAERLTLAARHLARSRT